MQSWVNDLKYILMPARRPVRGYQKEYNEAYRVWRAAWEKYRSEVGITQKLTSDGFMLPDEIGVLFYQDKCIGLSAFSYGRMGGPLEDLGWFNSWPADTIKTLRNISDDVVVCSQFTVNPEFAGKNQVVRWKDIISLYTLLRFENSDTDVMAGQLNLIRGMQNASGEDSGATVLNPEHVIHYSGLELPVQLVAYERLNIKKMMERKNIISLCDELWTKLDHISEFPVQKKVLPFKKVA